MAYRRTVAVDFDGVLHPYTRGWTGEIPVNEPPAEGALAFLLALNDAGYRIVVHSARASTPRGLDGIVHWLERYDLFQWVDDVTHLKPAAVAYVDDRAVPYTGDFAASLAGVLALNPDYDKDEVLNQEHSQGHHATRRVQLDAEGQR